MPRHTTLGVVLGLFLASTGCTAVEGTEAPELDESEIKAHKNTMFVSQRGELNQVSVFKKSGKLSGVMTGDGLVSPFGVTTAGRNIYVVSQGNNAVYAHLHRGGEHDCTRYRLTQLVEPGSGGLTNPFYIIEHDGLLYVSSHDTDEILTYDAQDGTFMGVAVEAGAGGLSGPRGLEFGPGG
ncbi:MAG TPA: hypothetical protein VKZ63_16175, partial [Kofleriaceae bacterium]|nr:hypothetical protein [Kofleriaceae bacterium]